MTVLNFGSLVSSLFAVGGELTMNAVKQFMSNTRNFAAIPELYYHDDGYFLARFRNSEEYTLTLCLLFLRKWSPDFVMKEELLKVMPIWVKFPTLPLHPRRA